MDAGRDEIYVGEYVLTDGAEAIGERLVTREEFLDQAREWQVVTPDPSIAAVARDGGFEVEEVDRVTSEAIARIGWKKILRGIRCLQKIWKRTTFDARMRRSLRRSCELRAVSFELRAASFEF